MSQNPTGKVAQNPINNPDVNKVRTRSRFPLSAPLKGTYRFGEYGVHFLYHGVADDKRVVLNSRHDVRSYTLKAPLMSDVKLNKDYVLVYNDAILPRQWDRILSNPTIGDDVDASQCNTVLPTFEATLRAIVTKLMAWTDESGISDAQLLERNLKSLFILEPFYSTGSLMAAFGANLHALYSTVSGNNFDDIFDNYISLVVSKVSSFDVFGSGVFSTPVKVKTSELVPSNENRALSLRQFIDVARTTFDWSISGVTLKSGQSVPSRLFSNSNVQLVLNAEPFNYGAFAAYQLACAQYFTNDRVDYVYDAELFRQSFWSLWTDSGLLDSVDQTFNWNGIKLEYDILSGHYVNGMFDAYRNGVLTDWNYFGEMVNGLFMYRRSLRFVDYFTGARPFPLAVGDSNIQVSSQGVNVVNVIEKTMAARFRNAVMRSGRRIGNYIEEILGGSSRPDYHQPFWIGRTTDTIFTQETENTGDLQFQLSNSVTSVLRSASTRFGFELDVDRPCYIIGITSFDIPRSYYRGVDKFFRHVDRFDMFNPFMQFIGDQPILRSERDEATADGSAVFGYQQRHMEYKQAIPRAFGGFVKALPGWDFLADESRSGLSDVTIDPDFIRSSPSEFDKFYVSLTGYSLGTYFHFIVKNTNMLESSRPMAYNPQLL